MQDYQMQLIKVLSFGLMVGLSSQQAFSNEIEMICSDEKGKKTLYKYEEDGKGKNIYYYNSKDGVYVDLCADTKYSPEDKEYMTVRKKTVTGAIIQCETVFLDTNNYPAPHVRIISSFDMSTLQLHRKINKSVRKNR